MKTQIRKIHVLSYHDHTGIVAKLEKMAAEGWLLEDIGPLFWIYRKSEPNSCSYQVVYSEYIPAAKDGWDYVSSSEKMHIFRSDNNCFQMEYAADKQLDIINSESKRHTFATNIGLIAIAAIQLYMTVSNWNELVWSASEIFRNVLWCTLALLSIINILEYQIWYRKALVSAATQNKLIATHRMSAINKGLFTIATLLLLGWLIASPAPESGGSVLLCIIIILGTAISMFISIKVNKHVKSQVAKTIIIALTWIIAIVVVFIIVMVLMVAGIVINDLYFM